MIQLSLRRNDKIVSSDFQVWKHNARGVTEELSQLNALDPCYYLHEDHIGSAAISFCQGHGLVGGISKNKKKVLFLYSSFLFLYFFFWSFRVCIWNIKDECISVGSSTGSSFWRTSRWRLRRYETASSLRPYLSTMIVISKKKPIFSVNLMWLNDHPSELGISRLRNEHELRESDWH